MKKILSALFASSITVVFVLAIMPVISSEASPVWKTLPSTPVLPGEPQGSYAPVNHIQMWYTIFGQGQPVLLLHGGLSNSNYWGNVVKILVRNHYQVIVADSRGHGRSTRTEDPYSYDLMSSDVLALLDYLKIPKVDLVGWSDGGILGIDIAIHHPERLRHLFAYGANTDPSGLRQGFDKDPTMMAFFDRSAVEYKKLSPTPTQYKQFMEQIGHMWDTQPNFTSQELQTIRVPTTIADGQYEEGILRSHTEYMAHTIPGAKLVIIPKVSHFAILQNPKALSSEILKCLNRP